MSSFLDTFGWNECSGTTDFLVCDYDLLISRIKFSTAVLMDGCAELGPASGSTDVPFLTQVYSNNMPKPY